METLFFGSTGPNVKLIQSLLNKIGYNAGAVDGIFGAATYAAIQAFQRDYGLVPDGIVGPATWNVLERLLLGYFTYTIKSGDTFYNLARRYFTTPTAIATANPNVDPNNLTVGSRIIIPFGYDLIFTDIDYTYEIMERQIRGLKARYPFLQVGSIGNSVMGKNLFSIRIGTGPNEVSYNASHHANEWITTMLLMKFIENFSKAYSVGGSIRGYSTTEIWNRSSIYLIPMVNPDGVNLVNYWPVYTNDAYTQAAQLNRTGLPLPRVWKANIRGVDLNLNYPAEWEKEHQLEIEQGITAPAPRDFGGTAPLTEPESNAMVTFTSQHNFRLVIAYHTQGKLIFYRFSDYNPPDAERIAQLFSDVSGYTISENPGEASYAGYKDWFIQTYNRPGFTIELGSGVNPLPVTQFPEIYEDNEEILLLGSLV